MPDSALYNQIFRKTSLQDALNQYLLAKEVEGLTSKTLKYYRDEIERFIVFVGETLIEDVTPDQIRRFLQHMAITRRKGGVHATYRPLRAWFLWYEEEVEPDDWHNPIRKIKLPGTRPVAIPGIEMDTYQRLVAICNGGHTDLRDRAMLYCLLDTCARASEFINLNVEDVNLVTGDILIRAGKGGDPRFVMIGTKTRKELKRYLKTRTDLAKDSPLFVTIEGDRFSYNNLYSLIRWRCKQAGIDNPGLHDIRRAGSLQLLRNGADISEISHYLGHKSIEVTMRYLAITPDDLRKMHRRASPVDRWKP